MVFIFLCYVLRLRRNVGDAAKRNNVNRLADMSYYRQYLLHIPAHMNVSRVNATAVMPVERCAATTRGCRLVVAVKYPSIIWAEIITAAITAALFAFVAFDGTINTVA